MYEKQVNLNLQKILLFKDYVSSKVGQERLPILMMMVTNLMWPWWFYYVSGHNVSAWETTLARGSAVTLSHMAILWFLGMTADFKTWFDLKSTFIRNSIIVVHQIVYSQTHFYLPYPVTNAITLTGPLFAFVVDYYMNGIEVNKKQIIGILAGVLGVLLASNSQFILYLIDDDYAPSSTFQHYKSNSLAFKTLVAFVSILLNVLWAYAMVLQKTFKHIAGIKISLFLGVYMIFVSGIAYLCGLFKPSGYFIGALFFSGLGMGICQILFISALNMTKKTGLLTLMMFLFIIPSYIISFFRYDQPLNPFCLFGIGLMLYGLYEAIFNKSQ